MSRGTLEDLNAKQSLLPLLPFGQAERRSGAGGSPKGDFPFVLGNFSASPPYTIFWAGGEIRVRSQSSEGFTKDEAGLQLGCRSITCMSAQKLALRDWK